MVQKIKESLFSLTFVVILIFGNPSMLQTEEKKGLDIEFVSEAFPQENKETTIKIVLRNPQNQAISNMKVVVADGFQNEKVTIYEGEVTLPPGELHSFLSKWTPQRNGLHSIHISARCVSPQIDTSVSKEIPVVSKQFWFPWFGSDKNFKYANIVLDDSPEGQEYWQERGAKPCAWKPGNQVIKDMVSAEQYMGILYEGIPNMKSKGILIDEIGDYDWNLSQMNLSSVGLKGLSELTSQHPELFVGIWVSGSLRPALCNITKNVYRQKGVDLLMLESYHNIQISEFQSYTRYAYFDQRINMARDLDVLTNCVITLGVSGTDRYEVTPEDLEDQIRYIRTMAPEMPGVGFFYADPKKEKLLKFADELCYKYWILPVVTVWDRDIFFSNVQSKPGEKVRISADIYNIGGMDARNVVVRFYCGNPAYGGKKIGRDIKVPLLSSTQEIPPGKNVVETIWEAKSGYHEIYVQVFVGRDERITVLNGEAKRTISVF